MKVDIVVRCFKIDTHLTATNCVIVEELVEALDSDLAQAMDIWNELHEDSI